MGGATFGVGLYTGTERSYVVRPRKPNGRAVLWFHGAGGDTLYLEPRLLQTAKINLTRGLVGRGYTVISADFGPSNGEHLWGNDSFLTSADALFADLNLWVTNTSKVFLWGESMGHFNACNWASRNIANVAGIIGTIPACGAEAVYQRNGNGASGESVLMDDAYGGTLGAFVTSGNLAARDPLTGLISNLATVPWRGYYATDDTVVADDAVDFAAAHVTAGGAGTAVSIGTGGHTDTVQLNINVSDFIDFVDAGEW